MTINCNFRFQVSIGFSFLFTEKFPPEYPPKTREEGFCCFKCLQIFSNKQLLKHHFDSEHRKPFQCEICLKFSGSSRSLNQHINADHTKKTKYECANCGSVFYYRANLAYHLASKHGEGVYICNECPKICSTKQQLQIHLNLKHLNKKKSFQCPIESCLKKYSSKFALIQHIKANHA